MSSRPAGPRLAWLLLLGLGLLAWAYLLWMDWGMGHTDQAGPLMPAMVGWGARDLLLVALMWALMMLAMMLPAAVPVLAVFAREAERLGHRARLLSFALAYFALWSGFSLVATLLQWALLEARLLSPMMVSASPWLSALLLLIAGAWQLSPWKQRCLHQCREPLAWLMRDWRPGSRGAWRLGWRHGLHCLGCCWALMGLLFVLGVMNLAWVLALSLLVLAEKALPWSRWPARLSGAVCLFWAAALLLQATQPS